jgi:hypothetical protein
MTVTLNDLQIEYVGVETLRPDPNNARIHSKKQIRQIARSIEEFGFVNGILVDDSLQVIAGHGRLLAAKLLGMDAVPIVRLSHLTPKQRRAYVLADNQLALNAGWDPDLLALELQGLIEMDFDLALTGFELGHIEIILDTANDKTADAGPEDAPPEALAAPPVSRPGDLWLLGSHRLICGDAREPRFYENLMAGEKADMGFTDPPYNMPISGHVSGLGAVKHEEFAMASGEMDRIQFTAFLQSSLSQMAAHARDGAILFTCMDWRHMREILAAGDDVEFELKNVIVWNKDNGGMGSFYRSKHELVCAWKYGTAPHTNNFELGQHGRYRTNVWDYAGVNTMKSGADRRAGDAPDRKAGGARGGRDQGCVPNARASSRPVWRLRVDADRGGEDKAQGSARRV